MKRLITLLLLLSSPAYATTRTVAKDCTGRGSPCYTTFSIASGGNGPVANADAADDSIVIWGPGTWTRDWYSVNVNNLKIVMVDSRGRTFDDPNAIVSDMPKMDAVGGAGSSGPGGLGIWRTSGTVTRCEVNGGEFVNADNTDLNGCQANGPNAVPFRIEQQSRGLFWLRNMVCHDNNMNYNGGPESLRVSNCKFYNPNNSCGNQHDMYVQPRDTGTNGCKWFLLEYSQVYAPTTGNAVKSRASNNYILYNRIYDGSGSAPNYNIDIPDEGLSYIIGNVIEQGTVASNFTIVSFGAESHANDDHTNGRHCWLFNNTIVNLRTPEGTFINSGTSLAGATITAKNNVFYGDRSSITGGLATFSLSNNYSELGLSNNIKFLNQSTGDYHLTAATPSPPLNSGVAPGTNDGYDCTPTKMYVYNLSSATRITSGGTMDIGAFEFSQSGGGGGGGGSDPCTPF